MSEAEEILVILSIPDCDMMEKQDLHHLFLWVHLSSEKLNVVFIQI